MNSYSNSLPIAIPTVMNHFFSWLGNHTQKMECRRDEKVINVRAQLILLMTGHLIIVNEFTQLVWLQDA